MLRHIYMHTIPIRTVLPTTITSNTLTSHTKTTAATILPNMCAHCAYAHIAHDRAINGSCTTRMLHSNHTHASLKPHACFTQGRERSLWWLIFWSEFVWRDVMVAPPSLARSLALSLSRSLSCSLALSLSLSLFSCSFSYLPNTHTHNHAFLCVYVCPCAHTHTLSLTHTYLHL